MESRFNVFISRYYSIKKIRRGPDTALCALGVHMENQWGFSCVGDTHRSLRSIHAGSSGDWTTQQRSQKPLQIVFGFKHFTEIHRKSWKEYHKISHTCLLAQCEQHETIFNRFYADFFFCYQNYTPGLKRESTMVRKRAMKCQGDVR